MGNTNSEDRNMVNVKFAVGQAIMHVANSWRDTSKDHVAHN